MVAQHESHSGVVDVEYPDAWEGVVEVESGSGSIDVSGRGVEVVREGKGRVVARKGKGGNGGRVVVMTGSGSVKVRLG